MKVRFLGTGTSQGVPVIGCDCSVCLSDDLNDKRLRSSIYIKYKNQNILIDSGPDLRQQILKNNTKKSALAFPNIPYFYEISQIKPFANIPLSWIDVTGIKASNEQVKQWEKEKPEVIVFNFMHTDVYDIQTLAFSNLEKKTFFFVSEFWNN